MVARVGVALTVNTQQGALRGRRAKTPSGRPYSAFQGIPYALPPVGPLRFKSPKPPEKWSGIRNATVKANRASQCSQCEDYCCTGDEDCLYLNIYTPKLPTSATAKLLPVMVWIHGGYFTLGSSSSYLYGPEHLLEHDVVLVTLNYRLGVLGFASTGDEVIPGNAGLKDQVMALKWIKNNVVNFGGDPKNVTIFGEDTGGISCHLLQISLAAKGLFHKVICQSGVASVELMSMPIKDRTFRLAQSLGFTGQSSEELLAFMRDQPAYRIVESEQNCLTKEEKQRMLSVLTFAPTIEPEGVEDAIITQDPMEILRSGKFNKVPTIIGVCACEGIPFIRVPKENNGGTWEINSNIHRLLPASILKREEDTKRFYFENQRLEESTVEIYADLYADLMIVYPALVAARVQSSVPGAQPVYFYHFDAVTNLNVVHKMFPKNYNRGAFHSEDIPYLFSGERFKDIPKGPETAEGKAIARITRLWTNFATKGNPTPDPEDSILSVSWPAFKRDDRYYLNITQDGLTVEKDLAELKMDFWDKIYMQ